MMQVIKRDGRREPVHFDKITQRMQHFMGGLDRRFVDPVVVTQQVVQGLYDGVTTAELDTLAAETAAALVVQHPDYALLAARIAVSNLHKLTEEKYGTFSKTAEALHGYHHEKTGEWAPLVSDMFIEVVRAHAAALDAAIDNTRDYDFDYFGFKTLERSYLLRLDGEIVERPQHLFMRVAVGIHGGAGLEKFDLEAALETYHLMSQRWFIHATPTLFNAGTPKPQLSSCFLLTMKDDSIPGIFETLKQCAEISKSAGGIGLSVHTIRAAGSYIRGTNGTSNGLVPMLRVFNDTARYVDQGGGKRKGAFAIYLEPWHADVFEFLELKKNHGKEELRARDLFYALWISDLFMKRVKENGDWSLFDPNEAPGLADCHSEEFEKLYTRYEREGRARKTVKAQVLWFAILDAQIETGTPYMLFKDHANRKSNQQNLGTIRSSNLCTEILEYTSPDEIAVCNLASIALNRFVIDGAFDHQRLYEVTKVVTRNLNKVIDINYYPVAEARRSNFRHRPIGLGVQGLADAFIQLGLAFDSDEARELNRDIFETIYFAACESSCELAQKHGAYETYAGSPASKGQLQYDLWGVTPGTRWDWAGLKARIAQHGLRNSLLLAPMPTASTSQILGNNECFEPYTSNIYTRRVLSGEFVVVNKHLLRELVERGLWNDTMRTRIIAGNGSIQHIHEIPAELREVFKTVWEIRQRVVLDMAADRGAFICQSQSLNVWMDEPTYAKLSSLHFYAWEKGLKTGMYYLRTKPAAQAIQFTVDQQLVMGLNVKGGSADAEGVQQAQVLANVEAAQHGGPMVAAQACAIDDPTCEACSA